MNLSRCRWLALGLLACCLAAWPASASTARTSVSIPFRILGKSAPLVVVRIQGRDVPLWLDLGMSTSLSLHPALLADLDRKDTGRSFSSIGMEGKVVASPVATFDAVELGGIAFSHVSVIPDTHDAAYRAKELPPASGFVGAGFFAGYRVVIDYHRLRLTLLPGRQRDTQPGACRGRVVPLVRDPAIDWGLVSRVQTDVGERLFVWDTGAPALVLLKAAALSAGLDASQAAATLAHVRMNGHDFGPLTFEIWDFPAPEGMAGLFGYDFFATHVVCVDLPRHRMLIR